MFKIIWKIRKENVEIEGEDTQLGPMSRVARWLTEVLARHKANIDDLYHLEIYEKKD